MVNTRLLVFRGGFSFSRFYGIIIFSTSTIRLLNGGFVIEIIARVLFFALAGVVIVLTLDAILRRRLSDKPEIEDTYGPGDVLFVLLPATQVRTKHLMVHIAQLLLRYGSVLTVDGAKERFNARRIIDQVVGWVRDERQIVLVAPSSGLILAVEIAADLEQTSKAEVSIITIDGLPSSIYLKPRGLRIAEFLPFGPICNLLTKLVWRFGFRPDKNALELLDTDADRDNLRRLWESYRSYPLSAWRDQLMFILRWANRQLLRKTRCVYIQSEHDEIVSDMATSICRIMTNKLIDVIPVPGMGHLRLLDRPDLYEAAVVRALELLKIERVS